MLPDFRLETYFSRWEFTARYHLCASDMESMSVNALLELADDDGRQQWDALRLGYTETFGAPDLRTAIAETYDNVEAADILCFAGAEEGIFASMQVLLSPGEHAIVITPNYQAAETIPGAICEVTGIPLDPNDNWNLDLDALRAAIRPNTKVISFNFPHNPTGKVVSHEDLDAIVDIARERGIYVLSDEVYRLLERNDDIRLPQVADIYERGLSLNVMSKAYGLPGLRIGWIATKNRELLSQMERAKHYLSICNSGPSEILSLIALRARDQILARNRALIENNLALVNGFFNEYDNLFDWALPDGGCIGYPCYRGADGVEAFCTTLVKKSGVLLLPASVYTSALNDTPAGHFRIGYGRANMAEGLAAMREHIEQSDAMCATG
ncbi:MAG: aminotransferase class I/II-fold pyridoxal phosphate-dependent enzyme [Woeseiaceae bacterium]|nr:aminotransferase class I/II-fold pyridoxal phosphate-dependent enzyme [Woeseiaceae bacterium]